MNERVEKFKFRRQLRKIDWDSVIKATTQTRRKGEASSMSNENYIPFGDEWEKAVMKLTKATIVKMYKKVCIEKLKLEDKLEKMS